MCCLDTSQEECTCRSQQRSVFAIRVEADFTAISLRSAICQHREMDTSTCTCNNFGIFLALQQHLLHTRTKHADAGSTAQNQATVLWNCNKRWFLPNFCLDLEHVSCRHLHHHDNRGEQHFIFALIHFYASRSMRSNVATLQGYS